jgi:hypothetical protein
MLSKQTQREIDTINRMDLKVAIPPKYEPMKYVTDSATTSTVEVKYIHIPSVISALIEEIRQRELEIMDVKKATRILLNIEREAKRGK